MEKLIIPLIHFVLLGFLPIQRMRASTDPRFAAACGQIVAVRLHSYWRIGGHSTLANRIHDAVALARAFRAEGFKTDLFDATDTFHCRMYQRAADVWHGFAKNAHEGLGSPRLIVPSTLVLLGGQVLPILLLIFAPSPLAVIGTIAALLPRLVAVVRFRQSIPGALLHPAGIALLVAIQWWALFSLQNPAAGRVERPRVFAGRGDMRIFLLALLLLNGVALAAPVKTLSDFELTDQDARARSYRFPKARVTVMTVADHKGSEQLAAWIQRLYDRYEQRIDIDGIADVSMIPKPFHRMFREAFRKQLTRSVMLDWGGAVVKQFGYARGVANLYVIDRRGRIVTSYAGPVNDAAERELTREIDRAISESSPK